MSIGIKEILFVLFILVLMLGAKRLPDIARGLGSGIRNFKGSLKTGAEGDSGQGEERHGS